VDVLKSLTVVVFVVYLVRLLLLVVANFLPLGPRHAGADSRKSASDGHAQCVEVASESDVTRLLQGRLHRRLQTSESLRLQRVQEQPAYGACPAQPSQGVLHTDIYRTPWPSKAQPSTDHSRSIAYSTCSSLMPYLAIQYRI